METLSRWTTQKLKLIFLLLVLLKQAGAILTDEERLHRDLFTNYSADTHPTLLPNESVLVIFDIQIIRIIDVSEKFQYIKTYAWINQYWNNSLLEWDPMKYGGIKEIHVAPRKVWVPDILLYNNVDNEDRLGGGLETYKANVAIYNTGRNKWLNPAMFKSICSVDVNYFPFDDQQCKMKFGSWSFDKSKLDMVPSISDGYSEYYIANGEWELISIDIERNAKVYQCCEHPFIDVTATIKLRRESVDYMLKLIIPCLLISSMIFLGFILPPESGERIGLSITVLLAMTVFQQLTSEIMPSYGFPLLGQYYFAIMMEIGISLVVTTLILNFYHRNTMNMPKIMKLILKLIARVLFPFKKRRKKSESVNEPDKPSDVTKSSEESLSFDESLFEDDRIRHLLLSRTLKTLRLAAV